MAINTAVNTANLANKAAQVGYTQNIQGPKETKRTEEPRQIKDLDEHGLDTLDQGRDNVEKSNLEDASGVNRQRTDAVRRDEGGRRQVQTRTETTATTETGKAGEAARTDGAQEQGPQQGDVATRTLRLALADNSKQLQAQFDTKQAQEGPQQNNAGPDARRTVMLRNLQSMVNTQLAQYTGNEPYSRSNYRQILGALTQMQGGGNSNKTQGSTDSRDNDAAAWGTGEGGETDGTYKLYSGQAAKVLEFLAPKPERAPGDEPLELVA